MGMGAGHLLTYIERVDMKKLGGKWRLRYRLVRFMMNIITDYEDMARLSFDAGCKMRKKGRTIKKVQLINPYRR